MRPSNSRTWLMACGVVVLILLVLAGRQLMSAGGPAMEFGDEYLYSPHSDSEQQKLDALVGKPAPILQVTDWINGEVQPADMKGKVVVLDLFATWCPPCLAAIPHNNAMYANLKDKGLVLVGVCSSSQGQENLAKVVAGSNTKIDYPVCKDPDSKTAESFNLSFYPTYVVIDRKGIIRAIGVEPGHVAPIVNKLLAEKVE